MKCVERSGIGKRETNEYATAQDFCRVFTEHMDDLYQLSTLLTCDNAKAEQCFVAGLEDCHQASHVFKEWAHSWAKRSIIRNAIRALQPSPEQISSVVPAAVPLSKSEVLLGSASDLCCVLSLGDFERFVFVISVLEKYKERDCALLLGCSILQVRQARTRALRCFANLADTSVAIPSKRLEQEQPCHSL